MFVNRATFWQMSPGMVKYPLATAPESVFNGEQKKVIGNALAQQLNVPLV
jgi:hypothetical protein